MKEHFHRTLDTRRNIRQCWLHIYYTFDRVAQTMKTIGFSKVVPLLYKRVQELVGYTFRHEFDLALMNLPLVERKTSEYFEDIMETAQSFKKADIGDFWFISANAGRFLPLFDSIEKEQRGTEKMIEKQWEQDSIQRLLLLEKVSSQFRKSARFVPDVGRAFYPFYIPNMKIREKPVFSIGIVPSYPVFGFEQRVKSTLLFACALHNAFAKRKLSFSTKISYFLLRVGKQRLLERRVISEWFTKFPKARYIPFI